MSLPLTALMLAVLLAIWLFVRKRRNDRPQTRQPGPKRSADQSAYHAVSIKFDANACDAARALEGRRFLSAAAPRLPLPDCDVLECRCRFVHHQDRRAGTDRRSPFGAGSFASGTGRFESDKRAGKDRRADDDDIF